MSKLGCVCGHIISDITDSLPYKAFFCSDVDDFDLWEKIMEGFRTFAKAICEDRRREWLLEHDFEECYVKLNLPDEEIFHDFLLGLIVLCGRHIYQCTECGRIHIEREDNTFYRFKPEDGNVHLMFAEKRLK